MTEQKLEDEIERRFAEPLPPIEKKLIGWSFGVGVVSPIVLAGISRYLPS